MKALVDATKSDDELLRNIALSGSYGSGKSSILREVARRESKRAFTVSLASVGLTEDTGPPRYPTNLLQKEILKQLLFRIAPRKAPASRFRRPGRQSSWRLARDVLSIGTLAAGLTCLLRNYDPTQIIDDWPKRFQAAAIAGAFLLGANALVSLSGFIAYRNRSVQFRAGPATLKLEDPAGNYFDDWLDEIVYIFEISKTELVIFEDLDRFDNPAIFDDLRDLNTVLNNAQQVHGGSRLRRARRVQFVYAIRDSVFDFERGSASQGAAVDRAKFFDLIVPVVPFLTHESSTDHVWATVRQAASDIPNDLIDLVSSSLVDMRLIKNIRNEFLMFREVTSSGTQALTTLTSAGLFAMVVYKNLYLSDYEQIRNGTSDLDEVYRMSRIVSGAAIRRIDRDLASIQNAETSRDRAVTFSDELHTHLVRMKRQLGLDSDSQIEFTVGDQTFEPDDTDTTAFWEGVTNEGLLGVTLGDDEASLSITVDDMVDLLGFDPRSLAPTAAEETDWIEEREKLVARKAKLSHSAMRDLIGDSTLSITTEDPDAEHEGEQITYAEYCRRTLPDSLAFELLARGYIDDNFTLYVSRYNDSRVSTTAKRYLIHNVRQNLFDPFFELTPADAAAVIERMERQEDDGDGVLNVSIFDQLLSQPQSRLLEMAADRLCAGGERESGFTTDYLRNGARPLALVTALAPRWAAGFEFLAHSDGVAEPRRTEFLGALLAGAAAETAYELGDPTRDLLSRMLPDIAVPSPPEADGGADSQSLLQMIQILDLKPLELARLDAAIADGLVDSGHYEINPSNLTYALGEHSDLALETIRDKKPAVYSVILEDLSSFIKSARSLNPRWHSIRDPKEFESVLSDIRRVAPEVDAIVRYSNHRCQVGRLTAVDSTYWPALVEHSRLRFTVANAALYVHRFGLDDTIIKFLNGGRPSDIGVSAIDPDVRNTFARAVLQSDGRIRGGARVVVRLARSAQPSRPMPASTLPLGPPALIGEALRTHLVKLDALLFEHLASAEWSVKERAIKVSSKSFPSIVSSDLLSRADWIRFFQSRVLSHTVRDAVFSQMEDILGDSNPAYPALVEWAVRRNRRCTDLQFRHLVTTSASPRSLFVLLAQNRRTVTPAEATEIVQLIGEPFTGLTKKWRTVEIPYTPAVQALLEQMTGTWPIAKVKPINADRLKVTTRRSL
ncbi:hypothetical protein ASC61_10320 [Aeromicrobium sp. Root344]|nr:hypothetical protein ASC61_10320 [Aeromicrobium sp. Root344]